MATTNDALADDNIPPPAYHDGGGIERLPSYRHGLLARHHPYGRYTSSLLQRLLSTPYAYDFDYAPVFLGNDAIVGIHAGVDDGAAANTANSVREHSSTGVPASSSSAPISPGQAGIASHDALSTRVAIDLSTSRSLKRKRDEYERQNDTE